MLGKEKVSVKASGQLQKRTVKKAGLTKTQPLPFNLSSSKRQKLEISDQKPEFVPLKVQVEQVFNGLRENTNEGSGAKQSGKTSQQRLTVPSDPVLLSNERSKLHEEIISTEEKILNEI